MTYLKTEAKRKKPGRGYTDGPTLIEAFEGLNKAIGRRSSTLAEHEPVNTGDSATGPPSKFNISVSGPSPDQAYDPKWWRLRLRDEKPLTSQDRRILAALISRLQDEIKGHIHRRNNDPNSGAAVHELKRAKHKLEERVKYLEAEIAANTGLATVQPEILTNVIANNAGQIERVIRGMRGEGWTPQRSPR